MSSTSSYRRPRLIGASAIALAALLLVGGQSAVPAAAESDASARSGADEPTSKVASGMVGFDLTNTNDSSVVCAPTPDGKEYRVRGRLIGPRAVLDGREPVVTVNVLVHDAGTGGWFFNLRQNPTYDYATQLAARGETSLVLDRLGYDRSGLADGNATCLGAQVHMLHQVVQHLRGGRYDFLGSRSSSKPPHVSHVVLHGHGTGATIAQLEAAHFDDVAGLVLMAPTTTSPSQLALEVARGQAAACSSGGTFAAYGETAADFRRMLFRTAPRGVVKAAVKRRNPTPCGDVATLPGALASTALNDRRVDVPVLVLEAGKDARRSGRGVAVTSTERITRRTFAGSGSALTLEKSAPKMQRVVARWLRSI